ncbi:hypothetical protein HDU76_010604, partial [Blyttiomyces sp. JEL0837]
MSAKGKSGDSVGVRYVQPPHISERLVPKILDAPTNTAEPAQAAKAMAVFEDFAEWVNEDSMKAVGRGLTKDVWDACGSLYGLPEQGYENLDSLARSLIRMARVMDAQPKGELPQLYKAFVRTAFSVYLAFLNADRSKRELRKFGTETFKTLTMAVHAMESIPTLTSKVQAAASIDNVASLTETEPA